MKHGMTLERIATALERIASALEKNPPSNGELPAALRAQFGLREFTAADALAVLDPLRRESTANIGRKLSAAGLERRRTAGGWVYRVPGSKPGPRAVLPDDVVEKITACRIAVNGRRIPAGQFWRGAYAGTGMRLTDARARELEARFPDVIAAG